MSHYGTTVQIKTETDASWLGVGAKIGKLANEWAGRNDLVAYVGERAGAEAGAPACYNPHTSEIEVNVSAAFGEATPEEVSDLTERSQQYEYPKATGAIYHEALHARYSSWDLEEASKNLTPTEFRWMHLLEESRIEKLGVLMNPRNRVFLRACALELVLADMKDSDMSKLSTVRQAAQALGLTAARVDAGVLEEDDIYPITSIVELVMPADVQDALRNIWVEFQGLSASQVVRMYELAREWEQILRDAGEDEEDGEDQEGGSGSGSGDSDFIEMLKRAVKDSAESNELGVSDDIYDEQKMDEFTSEANKADDARKERKAHEMVAEATFSKGTGPSDSRSVSELIDTRMPTPEERVSAVRIAKALEKAKYHDRIRTVKASDTPPGRLRTRALVQGQALREKRIDVNVEPFKRVQRHHTQDPELTIGVMVDISGSMKTAMKPMASAAWILSESVRRIQGKVGMVYYGSDVFATLKPGQHLERVTVYSAPDGTERFDKGFQAVDGALNLLNGRGARLLVIVSDGHYTSDEKQHAEKWIARCKRAGVGVLWIGAGNDGDYATRYCKSGNAVFTRMNESATGVADEIGRRAAEALEKAGAGR